MSNNLIEQSSEVMLYPKFYRTTVQRKILDFNRLWSKRAIDELPRSCVVHLIDDNFLLNKPIVFVPEDDNWLLGQKPYLKFINHVTQPVTGVIPLKEKFLLPQKGLVPTLLNYRKKTMRWMRPWKDTSKMPPILNSQAVISYLSLYRARIYGQLKATRRFDYILTSVLNNVCKLPNQMHFIPIPVGNTEYTKGEFVPSFKAYTKTSVRHPNDPWYQLCMHLYGFMHTGTESIFSKIPPTLLRNIHLVLYTKQNCLVVNLQNLLDFNQGIKDIVLIRFIKQLNTMAAEGHATPSIDYSAVEPKVDEETEDTADVKEEDINSEEIEKVLVTPKAPERAASPVTLNSKVDHEEVVSRPVANISKQDVYRFSRMSTIPIHDKVADRLKRFLTDNDLFGTADTTKIPTSIVDALANAKEQDKARPPLEYQEDGPMPEEPNKPQIPVHYSGPQVTANGGMKDKDMEVKLTKVEEEVAKLEESIPNFEEVDDKYVKIQPRLINNGTTVVNAPAYTKSPSTKAKEEYNTKAEEDIDIKSMETISQHTELTKAQTERAIKLSQAYKELELDGKKFKDIMEETPDDTVIANELDFLKDQVPDPSMLRSTIDRFDLEYIDKYFKKDLISELASFNKVGMFLKDFSMTDVSDSMNNMYLVVAKYEDLKHKQHTVKFTLPKVDKRGYCYINGGLKVLKKQRITNPICKVSPVRVTLASDFNKYLVERVTTVAHSFINYVDKIIETAGKTISPTFGSSALPAQTYPYEYTAISRKYTAMAVTEATDSSVWWFYFGAPDGTAAYFIDKGFDKADVDDAIATENDVKGYLIGMVKKDTPIYAYMKLDGTLVLYNQGDGVTDNSNTFIDLLCELCNVDIAHLSEWTEFKLLSKSVPTIFALAYRYGLSYMLNYTKCKYAIYDRKARYPRRQSDVIVKFKDKVLVIPRAPLSHSLLFAGLNNYDLSKVNIEEMDSKDIYYDLLQSKKMSVHNLKGIDNFFDLFVDPITREVLFRMGEPTEAKDLLIRATTLLTTEDHPPVAASTNYRFRSYERICTAIYKVLANNYSVYRYKGIGTSSTFSIRDFEITNMVINDQLMEPVDQINPMNDIIYREEYGHGGSGGRQSTDTFMVDDRQWPEDGVGIIGESSVDNGKTGYAGNMSNNPTIDNIRGLTISKKTDDIGASEAFTSSTLLGACVSQDDSKRASFFHIHLSHYVATKEMDLIRVRTGYERVVAHRCRPPFAYAAEEDGVIERIDQDAHILVVYYPKSNKRISVEYGDQYTSNGGGGFFCTQNIIINGFNQGDKVKRGDVIIYNERFFKPDPFNKQVDLSLGVLANVVLMDTNMTVEDSNVISAELAEKLEFNPVHPRDIVITKSTTIHKYAAVGTAVANTDPLLIFDQSAITDDMFGGLDAEAAALLGNLNKRTPRAKFTGRIVKIDAYYLGDTSNMSQSVKNLVNTINKDKARKAAVSKDTDNESDFPAATKVTQSTRIGTTVLDEETVIIRFYIQQDMSMSAGDKIEFDSSLKSVCGATKDQGWKTEDGLKIDALFSNLGSHKRLINSPTLVGISDRCLEKIENNVLDMYFNK